MARARTRRAPFDSRGGGAPVPGLCCEDDLPARKGDPGSPSLWREESVRRSEARTSGPLESYLSDKNAILGNSTRPFIMAIVHELVVRAQVGQLVLD